MSTEVFQVTHQNKKSDVLKIIQDEYDEIESIYDIYIIDDAERLIGVCPLFKLLIQKEDVEVGEIMIASDLKTLSPHTSWKEVASFMSKYNLINVPMVIRQLKK